MVENSTDAVELVDYKGKIKYASESLYKVLGYKPAEVVGDSIFDYIHPDDKKSVLMKLASLAVVPNKQTTAEFRVKNKSEKWVWIEAVGVNYLLKPNIQAIVGTFRDITERKKTTAALQDSEERLRLAVVAGNVGVWDWDVKSNQIKWSEKVYELHGMQPGTFSGSLADYEQLIYPEDREKVATAISQALKGKSYNLDFRILTSNGKIRWVTTSAHVTFDKKKKPIRMLGATMDISERKKLEEQKDEFLGIVSHELKTPVTSMKAFGQILQAHFNKKGDKKAGQMLQKMDLQINKLVSLIHDLLDVTKIEGGKLQFNEELFSIDSLVNEIVEEMQRTTKHNIIHEGKIGKKVFGDKERISQVIINFISNAIKYSPNANKIIIHTFSNKTKFTICVQDFGLGIPKKDLSKVFERFYRVEIKTHKMIPGIGLGLYICSEIINRQKGKIWVESEVGKGSKFCFELYLKSIN
ncbi:MAG TPA: PAS domain-containing protein [Candidatus Nitrosocosmicus sp.]|nr:PAS domain-containing protein [Candidatus Nitrosocosmicus sp.]